MNLKRSLKTLRQTLRKILHPLDIKLASYVVRINPNFIGYIPQFLVKIFFLRTFPVLSTVYLANHLSFRVLNDKEDWLLSNLVDGAVIPNLKSAQAKACENAIIYIIEHSNRLKLFAECLMQFHPDHPFFLTTVTRLARFFNQLKPYRLQIFLQQLSFLNDLKGQEKRLFWSALGQKLTRATVVDSESIVGDGYYAGSFKFVANGVVLHNSTCKPILANFDTLPVYQNPAEVIRLPPSHIIWCSETELKPAIELKILLQSLHALDLVKDKKIILISAREPVDRILPFLESIGITYAELKPCSALEFDQSVLDMGPYQIVPQKVLSTACAFYLPKASDAVLIIQGAHLSENIEKLKELLGAEAISKAKFFDFYLYDPIEILSIISSYQSVVYGEELPTEYEHFLLDKKKFFYNKHGVLSQPFDRGQQSAAHACGVTRASHY